MPYGKRGRIVLDTNTIVSALLGRDGKPARVLAEISKGNFINYVSEDILREVQEVLSRPKIVFKTSDHERQYLVNFITYFSEIITPKKKLRVMTEDPGDNKILECALEAKAHCIITGDKHLLKLRKYKTTAILDSGEFMGRMAGKG
ncbi:MAG: putative toxin-antitoxin system toxin component, PIN family [Candidatus Altiarchaeales archaeon]|nr:putative toxin-antitoxin system toxin component, PIN family [Candidatus Altiarchaeales archaeon]